MRQSKIIIADTIVPLLEQELAAFQSEAIFIISDENTERFCLPIILAIEKLRKSRLITIPADDEHKNIDTLTYIWDELSTHGATRHSLVINLGGGMVTDIGGFAAATFKRGCRFINIPTTLLSIVDAATGGKTGINFNGLKNEIGVFAPAQAVLVGTQFLATLDNKNLYSGFAEMIKHALISSKKEYATLLALSLEKQEWSKFCPILEANIAIKQRIVAEDPKETGIRKSLNFGHTIGHAIETLSHQTKQPVLHGYAIMWGMVCELYLSHIKMNFPSSTVTELLSYCKEYYGQPTFLCEHYETLYELMLHDKKNDGNGINFTLLSEIGQVHINQTATKNEIFEALDFLREN
ncbi:MAG: 3-dehydroquinate synthase [Bacteroidetes bacterium ADurb.Bin057]|nr:MAG: 3-dehydroquinate synthase [Bacteroidetes bacterium ADurb.Bin057]HPO47830.1 3-dehydroquinate synthase [Paludibacteraceae bacterium]